MHAVPRTWCTSYTSSRSTREPETRIRQFFFVGDSRIALVGFFRDLCILQPTVKQTITRQRVPTSPSSTVLLYTVSSTNPDQLSLGLTLAVKRFTDEEVPPKSTLMLQMHSAANHTDRHSPVYFSTSSTKENPTKNSSQVDVVKIHTQKKTVQKRFLILDLLAQELQVWYWLASYPNCRKYQP